VSKIFAGPDISISRVFFSNDSQDSIEPALKGNPGAWQIFMSRLIAAGV